MNQLPDLPGVPRHTRPVPADGLELAMRTGRRRRSLFLGTSAGAAAAVVGLITVIMLQPAAGGQSLRYAVDDPTPTETATASANPTPTEAGTTEQPSSQASPGDASPTPDNTDGPAATASPDSSTGPSPVAREAYTETTQDEAAPLNCTAPPSGHTGPLYYGGASSCTTSSGSSSTVKRGGAVSATASLCAPYGGGEVALGYDTGREHEVRVYDGSGALVYQFSQTVDYVQGPHQQAMADGRCLAWTGVWDTTLTNGELAPRGTYQVKISVHADIVNGRRTEPQEGAGAEFPVTVD